MRTDRRDVQGSLTYLQNAPGRLLRRWSLTGAGRLEHNNDWQPILTFGTLQARMTTASYWAINASATGYFEALDDRLTRSGPRATRTAW